MFRLTDDEIRQELAKLPNGSLFLPSAYEETSIQWNEFVARTQVKKIADKIEDMANDGDSICEVLKALREEE